MEFTVKHLGDLPKVAKHIISLFGNHRIVAFYGDMGAGKTTLIREITSQLGVVDVVTSPTFALVNSYMTAGGETIHHFDLYRMERIEEVFDIGYEEYLYSGELCLIEWPERIEELLPGGTLRVRIDVDPSGDVRTIGVE